MNSVTGNFFHTGYFGRLVSRYAFFQFSLCRNATFSFCDGIFSYNGNISLFIYISSSIPIHRLEIYEISVEVTLLFLSCFIYYSSCSSAKDDSIHF